MATVTAAVVRYRFDFVPSRSISTSLSIAELSSLSLRTHFHALDKGENSNRLGPETGDDSHSCLHCRASWWLNWDFVFFRNRGQAGSCRNDLERHTRIYIYMSKVSLSARVYTYIMICMNKFPGSIYERYCGRHVCVSPSINVYTHTI